MLPNKNHKGNIGNPSHPAIADQLRVKQQQSCWLLRIKDELRAEFDSLLRGLRNDFQREGTLEGVLVENLATGLWRKRRLLIAEGAEIRKGTEFLICGYAKRQDSDATLLFELESLGLVSGAENPIVLKKCLELLEILKESIEENGFDEKNDRPILA